MPGKLISLGQNGQEKQAFPVVHLHVFIGSDSFCDLRIKNKAVSPQHCLITSQKDKPALIRNLSRKLPTLVNGTEIGTQDVELQDQDVITIHNKQYKWQYDESHKHLNDSFDGKGRKSWPLFKNKLVAVVPPNRRDEVKELPLKKRRATVYAFENSSSKKNKVLGIKSGIKGARKSSYVKKVGVRVSPTTVNTSIGIGHVALSGRKSVKFADSVFSSVRRLGKRGKKSYGPATPYRSSSTPGKGKSSLYFTPPSTLGSNKTPKKGILKTPGSQQTSATKVGFRVLNLNNGTPPGLSASLSNLDESRVEKSGLRTPPKDESDQPEVVMRSSKRSSRGTSPNSTPRSALKSKQQRDDSLEASERAAKKLKQDPPVAIDKKKMAALLLCHRKSLTPHPEVNRRGRILLESKPDSPVQPPASPPSTPKSTKRITKEIRKSVPTPYTKVVPKVLRFGSLGNADTKPLKKKKKPPFKAVNLDRKNPISRAYAVAKMISTPSPPGRKMTRATRAARASREPLSRGEVTDVLSALDLSRKIPDPRKTTSPVTNLSGIKELFSTDKTLDVRELFLESSSLDNSRPSRRASKVSESEGVSLNSNEASNELPSSPLTNSRLSSQAGSTMSRRSLSLKGPRTPLSSPKLLNESKGSSGKKKNNKEPVSSPNLQDSITQFSDSNFSLGSFNSSKHKSRDASFLSTPQSPLKPSLSQKLNASSRSSITKMKKSRVSLRRIALTSSTPKLLKIPVIDLTRDSPERQLPLKKRPLLSVTTVPKSSHEESAVTKRSKSLPSKNLNTSKKSKAFEKELNDSDTSLEVNIGSMQKTISVSDTSLGKSSISFKSQLSKSVNLKLHDAPKIVARHSAPGKVTKVRTNRAQILSTSSQEKPTRSNSFINVNLFKLDKSPMNIVSSTPIRIKPTRSKSEVKIDLFKLDDNLSKSRLVKSLNKSKRFSKSLSPNQRRVSSVKPNKSDLSVRSSNIGDSSVLTSNISPIKKSHVSRKDLNASNVSDCLDNSSSVKSVRSESPVNIDILKLNNKLRSSFNNKLKKSFGNTNPSVLSPEFTKFSSERNLNKKESQGLSKSSIAQNKSTRSSSSINIDLFKLDEKPSMKKSVRSKSSEKISSKMSVTSKLSEIQMNKSSGDLSVSSVLNDTEKGFYKNKTPGSITKKSTRSNSAVNFDLFKLDEQSHTPTARSIKKEKSFGDKSNEKSFNRTCEVHEEAYDPSSMSFIDISSSFKGRKSDSFSAIRYSLDKSQNIKSKSLRRKRSTEMLENTSTHVRESPQKVKHSGSQEIKSSPIKSAKKVQHISAASGNKSTRSRSSISINLFKLDEKPLKQSISNRSTIDKSSRSKSAEGKLNSSVNLSKIESSSSNRKKSLSKTNEIINLVSGEPPHKSAKIRGSQSEVDLDKSGPTESKSTRSRSSINIDLFKLDDKPLNSSVTVSPGKDKLSRSKSAEGKIISPVSLGSTPRSSELQSRASSRREPVLKGAAKSANNNTNDSKLKVSLSSPKQSKFDQSGYDVSISSPKLRNPLSENTLSHFKPSRKRHSNDTFFIEANNSKISCKSIEQSDGKSTRSRTSIDIDLFKLDEKAASLKKSSINNQQFKEKISPTKTSLSHSLTSLANTIISPVASTPAVNIRKSKKSQVEISPIKRPKSSITSDSKVSKIENLAKEGEMPIQKTHSELHQNEAFRLSSRKNSKQNSIVFSPQDSLTPLYKKHNKSTRGTTTVNINLFGLDNKSPLKQSKKSSLTPSLQKLALSPYKKFSAKSPLKAKYSPKVYLTPLTAGQLKQFKETQTRTPPKIVYDSKHTQTSTTVEKSKRPSNKKHMQLDLFSKIPSVNFANNTTPVCDYQFKTGALGSLKAKRSVRQKEIDESHRSPQYSKSDKTPLSGFSPKGRGSVTGKQTPINRSSSSTQTPLGDKYKLLTSGIDGVTVKSKSKASMRSKTNYSPYEESASLKHSEAGKTRTMTPLLQDFVIDSTAKNTPQIKADPESTKVARLSNSKKGTKSRIIEEKRNEKSSPKTHHGKSAKLNIVSPKIAKMSPEKSSPIKRPRRGKPPKVVSLKAISPKQNKVISSTIVKRSSPKAKRTGADRKVLDDLSVNQENSINQSKTKRGKAPKIVSIISPIIKNSSPKGKRTRANEKVIDGEVPAKQRNKKDAIQEISSATEKTKSVGRQKVISLKTASPKPNKVIHSPVIKSSPLRSRQTRSNQKTSDKENSSLQLEIKINKKVKETKSKQDKIFEADKVIKPEPLNSLRGTKSGNKPAKNLVEKRGGSKEDTEDQEAVIASKKTSRRKWNAAKSPEKGATTSPIGKLGPSGDAHIPLIPETASRKNHPKSAKSNKVLAKSPVAKRGQPTRNANIHETKEPAERKLTKVVKSPEKATVKSPIVKRGRRAHNVEVEATSEPVVSLDRKLSKSVKSPDKAAAKSPVIKRGRRARNAEVKATSEPVVSLDRKLPKSVKSPDMAAAKSPVIKRGRRARNAEVEATSEPVVSLDRKLPKSVKSPDMAAAKSPVIKRGRRARNAEVEATSEPVVSLDRKLPKSVKSPDMAAAKSPVIKRGRRARNAEVEATSEPVVSLDRKLPKSVKSPDMAAAKSPVIKRGRRARNAEVEATSEPVVSLDRKLPKSVKSPDMAAAKSPVIKRGRRARNAEVEVTSEPVVSLGRKLPKRVKSPDMTESKPPAVKRGRLARNAEVHETPAPVVTLDSKLPKGLKSPGKTVPKLQVAKRGRPAHNAEVDVTSEPVVTLDRKLRKGAKSENTKVKSPLNKGEKSKKGKEKSTSKNSSNHEKPSSTKVIDVDQTSRTKTAKGRKASDSSKGNTLQVTPKVKLGLPKTDDAPKSTKLRKMKTSTTGIISPAVTRRGQSAKSLALKSNKLSHSSTKQKHSKGSSEKKTNLKTIMKATQQRKIGLASKVKQIMKLSGSSVLEEAKRATRSQKKKDERK